MAETHVVVRASEPGDAAAMQAIIAGEIAVHGTMQLPYQSVADWTRKLEDPPPGLHSLVACAGDVAGEVVGNLGLVGSPQRPRRRHAASIGMAVRDDWRIRGVGKALMRAAIDLADNWLQITRLELEVWTDNDVAIHLYESFGFEIEGTARRYAFRNGVLVDALHMARLHPPADGLA